MTRYINFQRRQIRERQLPLSSGLSRRDVVQAVCQVASSLTVPFSEENEGAELLPPPTPRLTAVEGWKAPLRRIEFSSPNSEQTTEVHGHENYSHEHFHEHSHSHSHSVDPRGPWYWHTCSRLWHIDYVHLFVEVVVHITLHAVLHWIFHNRRKAIQPVKNVARGLSHRWKRVRRGGGRRLYWAFERDTETGVPNVTTAGSSLTKAVAENIDGSQTDAEKYVDVIESDREEEEEEEEEENGDFLLREPKVTNDLKGGDRLPVISFNENIARRAALKEGSRRPTAIEGSEQRTSSVHSIASRCTNCSKTATHRRSNGLFEICVRCGLQRKMKKRIVPGRNDRRMPQEEPIRTKH